MNPSKARLKIMRQNGQSHPFRKLGRILKYGLIGFGRNIWLSVTATLVMTFTIFVLFVTVIASVTLSGTADAMREKIDITIFFKPGTSAATLAEMKSTMERDPNVRSVTTSTSEDEYHKFLKETEAGGDKDLLATLADDDMKEIMLKSMQATMRIKVNDAEDLSSIKHVVETDQTFVSHLDGSKEPTYDTNDTAINTIVSWANIANAGGLALSALFLVISILAIFNTIRMAIYSRSEEIYMEKLVGADNSFVRGPFLVEAMLSGILSGLFAITLGYVAFRLASPSLTAYDIDVSTIAGILYSPRLVLVYLVAVLAGALIGLVSARLAVHKYVKKI